MNYIDFHLNGIELSHEKANEEEQRWFVDAILDVNAQMHMRMNAREAGVPCIMVCHGPSDRGMGCIRPDKFVEVMHVATRTIYRAVVKRMNKGFVKLVLTRRCNGETTETVLFDYAVIKGYSVWTYRELREGEYQ